MKTKFHGIIEYTKEILVILFWILLVASVFLPHSSDVWLNAGLTQ
jgi:hypothetical protein